MGFHWRRRALCLVLGLFVGLSACADAAPTPVLFVVPAREIAVRFGFDMAALRSAFIISYQPVPGSNENLLHVWDGQRKQWIEIGLTHYVRGSLFTSPPGTVFLLGTDSELPTLLLDPPWARKVVRISEFNSAHMINTADQYLHFSPQEWRWLTPRYRLELKDLNEEQRRYGRYGPPGTQPAVPDRGAMNAAPAQENAPRPESEHVIVLEPLREEPVIEVAPAPEPVVEVAPAPEPVVEVAPAPEPVIEVAPAPEPVVEIAPQPREPEVEPQPAIAEPSWEPEPALEPVSKAPEAAASAAPPEPVDDVGPFPTVDVNQPDPGAK